MAHKKARKKTAVRTPAGEEIIRGLSGMRDTLAAGRELPEVYTVRSVHPVSEPRKWSSRDVRALRDGLRVSQAVFASLLGVSVKTVQSWEQGAVPPPMARRLLDCVRDDPRRWSAMLTGPVVSKPAA